MGTQNKPRDPRISFRRGNKEVPYIPWFELGRIWDVTCYHAISNRAFRPPTDSLRTCIRMLGSAYFLRHHMPSTVGLSWTCVVKYGGTQ